MDYSERVNFLEKYQTTISKIIKICDEGIQINQAEVEARKQLSETLFKVKEDYQIHQKFIKDHRDLMLDQGDNNWTTFVSHTSTDSRLINYLSNLKTDLTITTAPIFTIAASAATASDTSGNSLESLYSMDDSEYSIINSDAFHSQTEYIKKSLQSLNPTQKDQFEDFIREWIIKRDAFQKVYLLLKLRTIIFDKTIFYSNGQYGLKKGNLKDRIISFIIGYSTIDALPNTVCQRIDEISEQLAIKKSELSNIGKDRLNNVTNYQVDTLMRDTISLMASALKLRDAYFKNKSE